MRVPVRARASILGPPSFAAAKIMFSIKLARTDLRISLSRAKLDEATDFDVRVAVDRQKPRLLGEKQNFRSKNLVEKIFLASKNEMLGII